MVEKWRKVMWYTLEKWDEVLGQTWHACVLLYHNLLIPVLFTSKFCSLGRVYHKVTKIQPTETDSINQQKPTVWRILTTERQWQIFRGNEIKPTHIRIICTDKWEWTTHIRNIRWHMHEIFSITQIVHLYFQAKWIPMMSQLPQLLSNYGGKFSRDSNLLESCHFQVAMSAQPTGVFAAQVFVNASLVLLKVYAKF